MYEVDGGTGFEPDVGATLLVGPGIIEVGASPLVDPGVTEALVVTCPLEELVFFFFGVLGLQAVNSKAIKLIIKRVELFFMLTIIALFL